MILALEKMNGTTLLNTEEQLRNSLSAFNSGDVSALLPPGVFDTQRMADETESKKNSMLARSGAQTASGAKSFVGGIKAKRVKSKRGCPLVIRSGAKLSWVEDSGYGRSSGVLTKRVLDQVETLREIEQLIDSVVGESGMFDDLRGASIGINKLMGTLGIDASKYSGADAILFGVRALLAVFGMPSDPKDVLGGRTA